MSEVVPILGCFGLFLVVLPIWAIAEARRSRKESRELWKQVSEISGRLARLEHSVQERAERVSPVPLRAESARPSEPVATPAASPGVREEPAAAPPPPRDSSEPPPPRPPTPPAGPPRPSRSLDWESLISVRVFAWLGGAALFLGMGLFLQYSIQHNLISPAARVAIALLVGAVALAGGDALRTRGEWAGQAASGAGAAILYAALFAAHARYGLLGSAVTFAGMAFVTLAAGLLAARRRAYVVAVLGLVGGFLTPRLLATSEDHPVALFAYVLLLDVGAIALARRRGWLSIPGLALAASGVLFAGWAQQHLDAQKLPYALIAAALLALLFAAGKVPSSDVRTDQKEADLAIRIVAALGPLLLIVLVAGNGAFAIAPAFLAGYLLILIGGSFLVGRDAQFALLLPIAAGFCVAALSARVSPDLLSRRNEVLLLFSLPPAAFLALALLRRERESAAARAAAAISLAGGFLVVARFAELTRKETVLPLWLFAAAHAAGLLAIATVLASGAWIVAAQALLFGSLLALAVAVGLEVSRLPEFVPLIVGSAIAFWALPFLFERWRRDRLAWLSSALAPIVHFPVLYVLAKGEWGSTVLGAMAVLFAVGALFALRRSSALLESAADRQFTAALFGAVTLVFVTAAIPILLEKEWITVAWALESAALAWLWTRVPQEGLVRASAALAAATFVRLIVNPALWGYHARSGTPIVNWYLYTFGIPAASLLLAAALLRGGEWAERHRLPAILSAASGILLFVLVNVEIADFYSPGTALTFRLSGGGLAEDMTYSLAWGVFALILLALGITRESRPVRAAALLVLLLTIGKVFLHDLWDLGALYRVGSIVGLAVALLAVSFLTQRFVFVRQRP